MLEGLNVVELSTVLAGPAVGTFFAELGATVTKVEHPKNGDVTRSWKLPSESASSSVSAYFSSVNYRKNYVKIDLKTVEGVKKLHRLIQDADILISNFKKGDAEKFRCSNSELKKINPQLIHGKINGFGTKSDRVAYDLILQAESGFMSMNGTPESDPVKMPVALIDVLAAHHLKEGILLALLQRSKTNKGATVSVSLYDAAVSSLVNQASNYLMAKHIPKRIGSLHPNIAPYGEIFTTKDEQLITFAIGNDSHFERLCSVLQLPQLPNDNRFSDNQQRIANRKELALILQEKIDVWESENLLEKMLELYIPAGIVRSLDQVFEQKTAQKLIRKEKIDGQKTQRVTSIAFQWE